ncbi:MAG: ComEC/Rec2 family competence protein [Planctomycetaceae bacterium]|jgi:competence protein ComEC|nr:ComEC/Rec2 family competence protein [Planctomycetaceae bacterium]
MTSREPLPVCLLAMCLGVVIDKFLNFSATLWICFFSLTAAYWLIFCTRFFRLAKSQNPIIATSAVLILLMLTGGWRHHYYWNHYAANDPAAMFLLKYPTPTVIEGTVVTSPRWIPAPPFMPGQQIPPTDQTVFTIHTTELRNGGNWEPVNGHVEVSVAGKLSDVRYGDQLRLIGKLARPNPQQNPGDYDSASVLRQERILSMLRTDSTKAVTKLQNGSWFSVGRFLERVRNSAHSNISRYMTQEHATFASALILGVRDEVNPELSQIMIENGVSHIIAISGMHVGLVAIGLMFLLRFLHLRRRTFAVVLAAAVICYLFITDLRPSAVRATLLVLTACFSLFCGRQQMPTNAFAATGIIVLMWNPTNVFQLGTQLSFLATGVFLWFGKIFDLERYWKRKQPISMSEMEETEIRLKKIAIQESLFLNRQWIRIFKTLLFGLFCRCVNHIVNTFVVSLVIWSIVSPLIVASMHIFSPIAILINPLLWIPLMLALLSGFGVMFFGWFCSPLAVLFGHFGDFSYSLLTHFITWFHQYPYGYFWTPGFRNWWLVLFYLPLIVWTMIPVLRPKLRWIICWVTLCFLVAGMMSYVKQWDDWRNDRMTIRVLSVGHGLCVHIKMPDGKSILCDAGCLTSPYRSGNIAARSLWDTGNRTVEAIFLSHPDTDHYNGVPLILERFHVRSIYTTPYMFKKANIAVEATHNAITQRGIPIIEIAQADVIDKPNLPKIVILHPPPPTEQNENHDDSNRDSLVMLLEHRGYRILLPGDVESTLPLPFLQTPPEHVDLALAPHHGSVKKTTDLLINWSTPDVVVISGGLFTYQPNNKEQFEQLGCRVYETLESGMVEAVIDRGGIRVKTWR